MRCLLLFLFAAIALADSVAWFQAGRDGSASSSLRWQVHPKDFTTQVKPSINYKLYPTHAGLVLTEERWLYFMDYQGGIIKEHMSGAKEMVVDEMGGMYRITPKPDQLGHFFIERFTFTDGNITVLWHNERSYQRADNLVYMNHRVFFRCFGPTGNARLLVLNADTGRFVNEQVIGPYDQLEYRVAPKHNLIVYKAGAAEGRLMAWDGEVRQAFWSTDFTDVEHFVVDDERGVVFASRRDKECHPSIVTLDLEKGTVLKSTSYLTGALADYVASLAVTPQGRLAIQADVGSWHPYLHMFGLAESALNLRWQDQDNQYRHASTPAVLPDGTIVLAKTREMKAEIIRFEPKTGRVLNTWHLETRGVGVITSIQGTKDGVFVWDGEGHVHGFALKSYSEEDHV